MVGSMRLERMTSCLSDKRSIPLSYEPMAAPERVERPLTDSESGFLPIRRQGIWGDMRNLNPP